MTEGNEWVGGQKFGSSPRTLSLYKRLRKPTHGCTWKLVFKVNQNVSEKFSFLEWLYIFSSPNWVLCSLGAMVLELLQLTSV